MGNAQQNISEAIDKIAEDMGYDKDGMRLYLMLAGLDIIHLAGIIGNNPISVEHVEVIRNDFKGKGELDKLVGVIESRVLKARLKSFNIDQKRKVLKGE